MPPPNHVQISQNEGYIILAMSAFNSGQRDSILAAAKAYNISKSTKTEEEVLIKDILKLDL
ncbi:MAG: hypothetical protein FE78DRAFT_29680 [Acidomyces sp. 'richmondensis']|nr:MAG: hypothetical protein FE78DRAFT_29680 [Acidomyces sp. 'richmondensis']